MRHDITPELLRLIQQSIDDNRGSRANFCRDSGVKPYELSRILNGQKKVVYDDIWDKFCNYFPEIDDRQVKVGGGRNRVSNCGNNNFFPSAATDPDLISRAKLLAAVVDLDVPAEALVKFMQFVKNFGVVEK